MSVKNKVQLITYPDSLGGNLNKLNEILTNELKDVFQGGVHILPPFPSSGDRGFAPLTYFEIDPTFGSWDDIREIGSTHDVLVDVMVNHISKESAYFQDFLKHGRLSKYTDYFITLDKIWEDGNPVKEDIDKMFLRRELPYSSYLIESTKNKERVWTTFGKTDPSEQIDLDIHSEKVRELFVAIFDNFKDNNVKIVRLDAVGYIIKKMGTSCFFVEPEIYEFLDWIMEVAKSMNIELLPEVHSHYSIQYKLAKHGFWIYDFILPYRILDTLLHRSSKGLVEYLKTRPHKQFTMLDCHDGIPVKPDLDGLLEPGEANRVVDICVKRGANLSRIVSDEHKDADGFDVHQIRCSYYSMLDCNDDAYLVARAIQLFTPGIPQIYYVGLLAGENDYDGVERTGEGREINRYNFTHFEVKEAMEKDVVKRLISLIEFRNQYPAFNGKFIISDCEEDKLQLQWSDESTKCTLCVDLESMSSDISYVDERGQSVKYKI